MLQVARIEVNEVVSSARGDVSENLLREVAVRVDESNPMSAGNILNQDVPQKSCFSRAGFSNNVKVLALVFRQDAERGHGAPGLAFPKMDENIVHGLRASFDSER